MSLVQCIERVVCLFRGHDDLRVWEPGRLSVVCQACGRRSQGWAVGKVAR